MEIRDRVTDLIFKAKLRRRCSNVPRPTGSNCRRPPPNPAAAAAAAGDSPSSSATSKLRKQGLRPKQARSNRRAPSAMTTRSATEIVTVLDPRSGKKETMKFKKAKPLLRGWRLVNEVIELWRFARPRGSNCGQDDDDDRQDDPGGGPGGAVDHASSAIGSPMSRAIARTMCARRSSSRSPRSHGRQHPRRLFDETVKAMNRRCMSTSRGCPARCHRRRAWVVRSRGQAAPRPESPVGRAATRTRFVPQPPG